MYQIWKLTVKTYLNTVYFQKQIIEVLSDNYAIVTIEVYTNEQIKVELGYGSVVKLKSESAYWDIFAKRGNGKFMV